MAARDEDGRTPLHFAGPQNVEALLAAGADVAARDEDGRTPLHLAGSQTVETLLAAGADVAARDAGGRTPLHLAISRPTVETLLAAGADVAARSRTGETPLHRAAARTNDNPAAIEAFLAAGADREARDRQGRTPLHHAATHRGSVLGINVLLAAGADPDARDENGNTPLHLAAQYAHELFFDRNADGIRVWHSDMLQAALRDNDGLPPAGNQIQALLDAGADPTARNADGRTPWDLAEANEHLRLMGGDAYWRLNDARFNAPRQDSRRPDRDPARRC